MKKALGKGLGSLIPDQKTQEKDIQLINLNNIKPNKFQMRVEFDESKINELAASIKEHGVVQPILTVRSGKKYMLIAGERRLRASKVAGLKSIPCIVKDMTDEQSLLISLIENIQRENLSPLEEASAYDRMIKDFSMTQQEIAEKVGKSRSAVANMIRILGLPDELKALIDARKISAGHARALLSIADTKKRKFAADKIVKEKLTVREVEQLAASLSKKTKQNRAINSGKELPDPAIKKIEEKLEKILGTKIILKHKRGGKGVIAIEYYSVRDFERISDIICRK